jgi:hypothetical protein
VLQRSESPESSAATTLTAEGEAGDYVELGDFDIVSFLEDLTNDPAEVSLDASAYGAWNGDANKVGLLAREQLPGNSRAMRFCEPVLMVQSRSVSLELPSGEPVSGRKIRCALSVQRQMLHAGHDTYHLGRGTQYASS